MLAVAARRGRRQRLPKDVAFPAGVREVVILRDGMRRMIVPANMSWDDFFDAPGTVLGSREQLAVHGREAF